MTYEHAIILGVVQGLGEFLPISSSAHLILVPYLFGWERHSDVFDVALHLGTLAALLAFFWRDFIRLIGAGLSSGLKTSYGKQFWLIILASIPAGLVGFIFEDTIDMVLRTAYVAIAIALALMGIVLLYADKLAAKSRTEDTLSSFEAVIIGCSQALALLPGVSRSGATMTAGLLLGLTRASAARFSFLMSAPIIAGAGIVKLRHLGLSDIDGPFVFGIITAGIVGWASIRYLLQYLQTGSFKVFAWYRLVLALLVLIVVWGRNG